ncbi:MAG: BadF/BadG/BcrA/BcrD ATPase family protein [Rhodospirillaceae bacterium]
MIDLYLGVDAGGSHCRARIADASGKVLGAGEAGPANARIGMERLRATLMEACGHALHQAGLQNAGERISAGLGIAGISRPGVREALANLDLPFAKVRWETDAAIANLGAHNGGDGATLILGTGSIAYIKVNGGSFSIGGYGFPISDEGGGAALGLSAVRHALRALDGRTKPTPLSAAITSRFSHETPRVIAWMDIATPKDYAAFAPVVFDFAEADDEIARSIVESAALHVETFIETIFLKGAPRCALAGGLAPRMCPWLRERTAARLSPAMGDPLNGALLLAGLRKSQ